MSISEIREYIKQKLASALKSEELKNVKTATKELIRELSSLEKRGQFKKENDIKDLHEWFGEEMGKAFLDIVYEEIKDEFS